MNIPLNQKSSLDEIKHRFDNDVERFSNLETGQSATIDAPLAMDLITEAAIASTPKINKVLDIGCGAGNNTLKLLSKGISFDADLLDLSMPMLLRAKERVSEVNTGDTKIIQKDFRVADLPGEGYDVIMAAAVLHHLRDDADWECAFEKLYAVTAPGGSVWITDLVSHEISAIQDLMWQRYGNYLSTLGGDEYREKVFDYIEKEDSPRPLTYQLDLLRKVGFDQVEILHKNSTFAAYGAVKKL